MNTESIWNDYHNRLHSFILSRVKNKAIADDILQDVFVKIHHKIDSLKENDKIVSWIYQIAKNSIIDHYRKQMKTSEIPESLMMPEMPISEKTKNEILECLLPIVEKLPDRYRKAVVLSEIEGLSQKAAADILKLSLSGAKSRIQRGRVMIKNMLLACCRFEFSHQGVPIDYTCKDSRCNKC